MSKEQVRETAYGLMLILGTIQDEMNKGGEAPNKWEVDSMYNLAANINAYFEA